MNESNKDPNQETPKRVTPDQINAVINGATGNVRSRRSTDEWSNTGTNVSYNDATAPGGGGAVGTGQASGQSATGASISQAAEPHVASSNSNPEAADHIMPDDMNDGLDRKTSGTP